MYWCQLCIYNSIIFQKAQSHISKQFREQINVMPICLNQLIHTVLYRAIYHCIVIQSSHHCMDYLIVLLVIINVVVMGSAGQYFGNIVIFHWTISYCEHFLILKYRITIFIVFMYAKDECNGSL